MTKTKLELSEDILAAKKVLANAEAALLALECAPENNVFDTLEQAASVLEDALLDLASSDCEGSYNCGDEKYTREFMVGGKTYVGTLTVEYNRHDKTYYFVESYEFTHAEKV